MDGERADLIGAVVAAIGVARLRRASSAMRLILTNHPEKFPGQRGCRP